MKSPLRNVLKPKNSLFLSCSAPLKCEIFRPGSDSYAYENPWPKLNKGRLDWLFQDGWRRPLTKDQGAKMVSRKSMTF